MSDVSDDTLRQLEEMGKASKEADQKKKEVAAKELIIRERRVDGQIEELEKNDKELEIAQATNYGEMTPEQVAQTQKDSREYMYGAKHCMMFINKEFAGAVPYFRKNLILICAETGSGKSTAVANIVATTLAQKNPATGKGMRCLVITNEERREDVYNRLTCFRDDVHYVNHGSFSDAQILEFDKNIPVLSKVVTVIDDYFGSTPEVPVTGITTSLEGIQSIFDNLIAQNVIYDVVVIDYYQNVNKSKKHPELSNWQVQERLASMLDQYKNTYAAPIVLLAQLTPQNEDNSIPFKTRIEGRKSLLNACTIAIEMVPDKENLETKWVIQKNRFGEFTGTKIVTGYDNGRFVLKTEQFKKKVEEIKQKRISREQDKAIGIPDLREKKDGEVS